MFPAALKKLYDRFIRNHLPRKLASFNGVAVRQPRLLDQTDVRPDYEGALVAAIREEVHSGDNVVVIGGGWGVGTVVTAREVGPDGHVHTFEGAGKQVDRVRETVSLNRVEEQVTVVHAVVGSGDYLYDGESGVDIAPRDLPGCDVLVLDCEGAELDVIPKIGCEPTTVIVECHPMYDAPADAVVKLLEERGYSVTETRLEPTPYGDLPILTAKRARKTSNVN